MGDFGRCLVARFQKLGEIIHESGVASNQKRFYSLRSVVRRGICSLKSQSWEECDCGG